MALTTPRGFSGGPMADIDYGIGAAGGAWVETAAALAVTQPNTGTRTVSIAAGTGVAFGVRVSNDAALTQALAAPGSGGAWYMLALRFSWSAKTVTLQALAGATTGSTTAPTSMPTALPGTMLSTPGTTFDLPLAWAFVNSANTTVTLFDLRMRSTGGEMLAAVNYWALMVSAQQGWVTEGAVVSVLQHILPSGGTHQRSAWRRTTIGWRLLNRIEVDDTAITTAGSQSYYVVTANSRADLLTIAQLASMPQPLQLNPHDELVDYYDGTVYRFAGPNQSIQWRPWDSRWLDITTLASWGGATPSPNPAANSQVRTRIAAGVAWVEVFATIQNTSGDPVTIGGMPFGRGTNGKSAQPVSSLFLGKGGSSYPLYCDWTSGTEGASVLAIKALSNGVWVATAGQSVPTNWGGATLYGCLSYTPAGSFA